MNDSYEGQNELAILRATLAEDADGEMASQDCEDATAKFCKHCDRGLGAKHAAECPASRAMDAHSAEDLEFDPYPAISEGTDGYWVAAWVWVPKDEEDA